MTYDKYSFLDICNYVLITTSINIILFWSARGTVIVVLINEKVLLDKVFYL